MNEWSLNTENLDGEEFFFPTDSQLLDGQTPLPTGTMPTLDGLTDGLRGVTLLRGEANSSAGMLAVQVGVDTVVNNPGTCLVVFCYLINRWWINNHLGWHGVRPGDAVLQRLSVLNHDVDGQVRVAEPGFCSKVEEAKRRANAERSIVVVDELYRYRKPPKRRTWNHQLADDAFAKRLRDAQRASGDAWIVLAGHDMQGCFDRVLEYQDLPVSPNVDQGLLTVRVGESRDAVGRVGLEYDRRQLRLRERM